MSDVYQTPASELTESGNLEGYGSLEKGQAGQFDFSIRAIISESWEKTSGSKGTIWLAMFLYVLILGLVSFGITMLMGVVGMASMSEPGGFAVGAIAGTVLSELVIVAITLPLGAGLFMIGLKCAVGAPASGTEVFDYYPKTLALLGTVILMYIMIIIGFLLFIIPGIYLMFAYYLAIPLVVEKGLSPWQALEASRKAISKRWFRFVGLGIALGIIMSLSMIPLGIGLIWTLPMLMIGYGIAYRNIFGYDGAVTAK